MKYCSSCGATVSKKIPPADNRERHVCDHCDLIHYQNPKVVAGTLPIYEGKILLCRRAIEPRQGLWTLPGGFMENGETVTEAALRETQEEACAEVKLEGLYSLVSLPHINQVQMFFLASMEKPIFNAGEESLEVKLFSPAEIPWQQLAFTAITATLQNYVNDQAEGQFPLRHIVL